MGKAPREATRRREAAYEARGLEDPALDDDALIVAMVAERILIERRIVASDRGVRLGRPPETVADIL